MKRNTNSTARTTSAKSATPSTPKKRGRPPKKVVAVDKNGTWKTGLITTSNKSLAEQEGWVNTTELLKDALLDGKNLLIEQLRKGIENQDKQITKLKVDILDQTAVINYLEKKVDKLKKELANG